MDGPVRLSFVTTFSEKDEDKDLISAHSFNCGNILVDDLGWTQISSYFGSFGYCFHLWYGWYGCTGEIWEYGDTL